MRLFFRLLYHPFAWTYDFVASVVSRGRWKRWIFSVLPYVQGSLILELGHGPGHLQARLMQKGVFAVGLDESSQMSRIAYRRLRAASKSPLLVRGLAQGLPFSSDTFHTVVATFPTHYIFHPDTIQEIKRVLVPQGQIIILLSAWITGKGCIDRFLARLYQLTGEVPSDQTDYTRFLQPFLDAGMDVDLLWLDLPGSRLLMIVTPPPAHTQA
jgi:ubiquinone/menaquinone biosynthesis C-methylase UbiE